MLLLAKRAAAASAVGAMLVIGSAAAPASADSPPVNVPPGGSLNGTSVAVPLRNAYALDDAGVVTGNGNRSRAATWNSNTGTFTWYGGLEGIRSSAITAISPTGEVAGIAEVIAGPT